MSDLKAKMHQNRFPRPRLESLQCSPGPLAGFKGPTSKGKGGVQEGEGRGWVKGRREGKKGSGKGILAIPIL